MGALVDMFLNSVPANNFKLLNLSLRVAAYCIMAVYKYSFDLTTSTHVYKLIVDINKLLNFFVFVVQLELWYLTFKNIGRSSRSQCINNFSEKLTIRVYAESKLISNPKFKKLKNVARSGIIGVEKVNNIYYNKTFQNK